MQTWKMRKPANQVCVKKNQICGNFFILFVISFVKAKNAKLPFRAPERTTSFFYSCKKGTQMDITIYVSKLMDKHFRHYTHVPHFVLTSAHTFLGTLILTINTLL